MLLLHCRVAQQHVPSSHSLQLGGSGQLLPLLGCLLEALRLLRPQLDQLYLHLPQPLLQHLHT